MTRLRRSGVQAAKASMLDDAASLIEGYDFHVAVGTSEALDVTTEEVEAAAAELARQLRAWAVRITPLTVDR